MTVNPIGSILALVLTLGVSAPLAAEAQQAGKMPFIPPTRPRLRPFAKGFGTSATVEGQNLIIDWRYQLGRDNRLSTLAAELVRLKPDVIVVDATGAVRAAMQATSTIPIVMASSADAVGSGVVSNLGRPGRNVTGVTIMLEEVSTKRLQPSRMRCRT